MRKLLLTAVAAAAIASPAMARDGQAYVGIEAGALFARNMNFDYFDGFDTTRNAFIIDHKTGYDVDLIGGYDFGFIRAELELARKNAAHKDYTFNIGTPETIKADGRTSVSSIMGNLLADFGNQDGLSFYAGGGIGAATTRIRLQDADPTDTAHIKDSHLAWQAIAGIRYALSPSVDVGLKYRYFNTKISDRSVFFSADSVRDKFRSHSLLASLIYNFGAPAIAPAPVVMAPPPPPPAPEPVQTQVCYDGSVIPVTSVCPSPPPPPAPAPQPGERG